MVRLADVGVALAAAEPLGDFLGRLRLTDAGVFSVVAASAAAAASDETWRVADAQPLRQRLVLFHHALLQFLPNKNGHEIDFDFAKGNYRGKTRSAKTIDTRNGWVEKKRQNAVKKIQFHWKKRKFWNE